MTSDEVAGRWAAGASAVLWDAATRAGRLAAAVATDWLDGRGVEWAERISALRRDLEDTAQEADELARRLHDPHRPQEGLSGALATALQAASAASRGGSTARPGGPQLADTAGARVDDEHGVHIAQLLDPP